MPHRRMRDTEPMNRYTELYNHKANGDPSVLDCPQTDTEDDHPNLRKEMEAAVQSLKKVKSAGVYNIPTELVQTGGDGIITAPTTTCTRSGRLENGQPPGPSP